MYWVEFSLVVLDQLFLRFCMHCLCTVSAWSARRKWAVPAANAEETLFLEISITLCNIVFKKAYGTLQATHIHSKVVEFFWLIFWLTWTQGGPNFKSLGWCVPWIKESEKGTRSKMFNELAACRRKKEGRWRNKYSRRKEFRKGTNEILNAHK